MIITHIQAVFDFCAGWELLSWELRFQGVSRGRRTGMGSGEEEMVPGTPGGVGQEKQWIEAITDQFSVKETHWDTRCERLSQKHLHKSGECSELWL